MQSHPFYSYDIILPIFSHLLSSNDFISLMVTKIPVKCTLSEKLSTNVYEITTHTSTRINYATTLSLWKKKFSFEKILYTLFLLMKITDINNFARSLLIFQRDFEYKEF